MVNKNEAVKALDVCSICGFYPSFERINNVPYCKMHYERQLDIKKASVYSDKSNKRLDDLRQAISIRPTIHDDSGG